MATLKKYLAVGTMVLMLSTLGASLVLAEEVPPSDVENLAAFPGDGQVTLSWDPATDDTEVTGYFVYYGLTSVSENGGSYTFGATDAGDTTSLVVENLSNDVTYYFAATAYDADGNESEFYSFEVEATPETSEVGDFTEPTVSSATAMTSTLIELTFSEEVELPVDGSTAISIASTDGAALEVVDAYVSEDATVVFVVTEEQEAGTDYLLTAGIEVMDLNGNPVVSGTSDTALFTGSGVLAAEEPDEEVVDEEIVDEEAPDLEATPADGFELEDVEATDANELVLTFSEDVMDVTPEAFTIQLLEDASVEVIVLAVSVDEDDATMVTLVTEEMDAGFDYVVSVDETVLNELSLSLSSEGADMEFTAPLLDLADLIAPEDITNLLASLSGEDSILLSWTASEDSAGDLAEYLVYQSLDGTSFGDAVVLAMELTEYEAAGLTPGETYTFKVTAMDENGNESEGIMTTVTLPETGPGLLVMGGLSMLGAGVATRRRKRKDEF